MSTKKSSGKLNPNRSPSQDIMAKCAGGIGSKEYRRNFFSSDPFGFLAGAVKNIAKKITK